MHCKIFATSLGSIIGWVEDHTFSNTSGNGIPYVDLSLEETSEIKVFDACYITSRPSVTQETDEFGMIHDIEGPIVTDYIPIRPNPNQFLTFIDLNLNSVIYSYPVLDTDEENIKSYINKLMGRMPTHNATQN